MSNKKLLTLGNSKEHGNNISLSDFSWDCGWYWSGGYLGNRSCHFHLDSYFSKNVCAFDAIKADFGDSLLISDEHLWRFVDLFVQFYAHTKSAEAFQYGGHMTSRGRKEEEINKTLAKAINDHIRDVIIPAVHEICEEINKDQSEKQKAALV